MSLCRDWLRFGLDLIAQTDKPQVPPIAGHFGNKSFVHLLAGRFP